MYAHDLSNAIRVERPGISRACESARERGASGEAGLLADRLDDFRVAVARARDADAAREVDELVAVGVDKVGRVTRGAEALGELELGARHEPAREVRIALCSFDAAMAKLPSYEGKRGAAADCK